MILIYILKAFLALLPALTLSYNYGLMSFVSYQLFAFIIFWAISFWSVWQLTERKQIINRYLLITEISCYLIPFSSIIFLYFVFVQQLTPPSIRASENLTATVVQQTSSIMTTVVNEQLGSFNKSLNDEIKRTQNKLIEKLNKLTTELDKSNSKLQKNIKQGADKEIGKLKEELKKTKTKLDKLNKKLRKFKLKEINLELDRYVKKVDDELANIDKELQKASKELEDTKIKMDRLIKDLSKERKTKQPVLSSKIALNLVQAIVPFVEIYLKSIYVILAVIIGLIGGIITRFIRDFYHHKLLMQSEKQPESIVSRHSVYIVIASMFFLAYMLGPVSPLL